MSHDLEEIGFLQDWLDCFLYPEKDFKPLKNSAFLKFSKSLFEKRPSAQYIVDHRYQYPCEGSCHGLVLGCYDPSIIVFCLGSPSHVILPSDTACLAMPAALKAGASALAGLVLSCQPPRVGVGTVCFRRACTG